jgi:ubiquinone/menaquinone biosynthesis C-methylase UbiE
MADTEQEILVSKAFSTQSSSFDKIDKENDIIGWMRGRVRDEVLKYIPAKAKMLELNCGTGIDSVFFAQKGMEVLATDNAEGMLNELNKKIQAIGLQHTLQTQRCSFNTLELLGDKKFDYIFSNFGGLNCTEDLAKVLRDTDSLLKPGGFFSFVIMPTICPWEIIMFFKGYFKTAFRRFNANGTSAHLEDTHFKCYYYNPSFVTKQMGESYSLVSLKGLSITVPPPFIEHFIDKHPKLFKLLEKCENSLWDKRPFSSWCDHYIITMQKL